MAGTRTKLAIIGATRVRSESAASGSRTAPKTQKPRAPSTLTSTHRTATGPNSRRLPSRNAHRNPIRAPTAKANKPAPMLASGPPVTIAKSHPESGMATAMTAARTSTAPMMRMTFSILPPGTCRNRRRYLDVNGASGGSPT